MTELRALKARPAVSWGSQAADVEVRAKARQLRELRRRVALGNSQDTPNQPKQPVSGVVSVTPHRSADPVAWRNAVWQERDAGLPEHVLLARHNRRSALRSRVLAKHVEDTTKGRAYALRDAARVAHPSSRCSDCGEILHGLPALMKRPDGGHCVSGVVTCANVWACPVCAMRIKGARAEQISKGIDLHRQHFGAESLLMLTLTASHSAGDDLRRYREAFQQAAGRLFSSHWVEEVGLAGYVYGAEVTHGVSGFHYHRHYVLAFRGNVDAEKREALRAYLSKRWADLVVRFMGEQYRPNEHGLDLSRLHLSQYISKLGLEVSDVGEKVARGGNRSPWGLLAAAAAGHGPSFDVLAHYVSSMRGAKCIQLSNRLKELWENLGVADVDEQADETLGSALVSEIPLDAWRDIRSTGGLFRLLTLADAGTLPVWPVDSQWGDGWNVEREALRDESEFPTIAREPEVDKRARLKLVAASYNAHCDALLPPRKVRTPIDPYADGSPTLRYERLRKKMKAQLALKGMW